MGFSNLASGGRKPPVKSATGGLRPPLAVLLLLSLSGGLSAGEPVRLTSDGKLKFSPVFWSGGKEVLYADLEKPEQFQLRRLILATKAVEPLHPKAATSEFEPAVSADG